MKARQHFQLSSLRLLSLVAVSAIGIAAFFWPFFATPTSVLADHSLDAPWLFGALVLLVLAVMLTHLSADGVDARSVAILGMLIALAAALRPVGAGTAGLEPMWVVLVVGGRVLGRGFGFVLGTLAMLVSAIVTGGVGPWLPFQMIAAGWIGFGAACLPKMSGRKEVIALATYGALSALAYGFLLNLWFWPWAQGLSESLSYINGISVGENISHWLRFCLATSLGFDIPRMLLTGVLVMIAGRPVLRTLRHVVREARFDAPVQFENPQTSATAERDRYSQMPRM